MIIDEFLKMACLDGMLDDFIIDKNIIKMKDEKGEVAVIVESKEDVFKTTFALNNVNAVLNVIKSNALTECSEEADKLLFKSKTSNSKYTKFKADPSIYDNSTSRVLSKSKEDLLNLYSDKKIVIKLTDDLVKKIRNVVNTKLSDEIRFYSKSNKLFISVKSEAMDEFESYLCDTDLTIDNNYHSDKLTKIINNISNNYEIILEYNNEDEKALPLFIMGKTESGLDTSYFIMPILEY
jgi:hypothetical protein